MVSRTAVYATAKALGYECIESTVQNHYPDFTFHKGIGAKGKIAIDVKTTYRMHDNDKFSHNLGACTSFIQPGNEKKTIVFPFDHYAEHLVISFVYNRIAEKKAQTEHKLSVDQLKDIHLPFGNVEVFVNACASGRGLTYHVLTPPAVTQSCRPLHVGSENQVVLSADKVLRLVSVNLI